MPCRSTTCVVAVIVAADVLDVTLLLIQVRVRVKKSHEKCSERCKLERRKMANLAPEDFERLQVNWEAFPVLKNSK